MAKMMDHSFHSFPGPGKLKIQQLTPLEILNKRAKQTPFVLWQLAWNGMTMTDIPIQFPGILQSADSAGWLLDYYSTKYQNRAH